MIGRIRTDRDFSYEVVGFGVFALGFVMFVVKEIDDDMIVTKAEQIVEKNKEVVLLDALPFSIYVKIKE